MTSPSIEQLYQRGLASQQASAAVAANPPAPPPTTRPFPPMNYDAWQRAKKIALEKDLDFSKQVWEQGLREKEELINEGKGFWELPAQKQYDQIVIHEPLYEPRLLGVIRDAMYEAVSAPIKEQTVLMQQAIAAGQLDPMTLPPQVPSRKGYHAEMTGQQLTQAMPDLAAELSLDPTMWQMVPGEWLQTLYQKAGRETSMRMDRYAELRKMYGT